MVAYDESVAHLRQKANDLEKVHPLIDAAIGFILYAGVALAILAVVMTYPPYTVHQILRISGGCGVVGCLSAYAYRWFTIRRLRKLADQLEHDTAKLDAGLTYTGPKDPEGPVNQLKLTAFIALYKGYRWYERQGSTASAAAYRHRLQDIRVTCNLATLEAIDKAIESGNIEPPVGGPTPSFN